MLVGGLQHQVAGALVFRLHRALLGGLGGQRLAQQITHALDAGGGFHRAAHPLHGPGLHHVAVALQLQQQLAAAHVHLGSIIAGDGVVGADAQVLLVFQHPHAAQLGCGEDVGVVQQIVECDHGKTSLLLVRPCARRPERGQRRKKMPCICGHYTTEARKRKDILGFFYQSKTAAEGPAAVLNKLSCPFQISGSHRRWR